nr:hypothetical protein [uncultured Desulfobacter sp.]
MTLWISLIRLDRCSTPGKGKDSLSLICLEKNRPEGTGYPGIFFHYISPSREPGPEFRHLSLGSMTQVTPAHWPHPMAGEAPVPFAIG